MKPRSRRRPRPPRTESVPDPDRLLFDPGESEPIEFDEVLPLLPLRDVVIFPGMVVPLLVGRPASVAAVERAGDGDKIFVVAAQEDPRQTNPEPEDVHDIGTVVRTIQVLRVPDGTLRLLVEGICRVRLDEVHEEPNYLEALVVPVEPPETTTPRLKALARGVHSAFQEYVELNRRVPDEVASAVDALDGPRRIANIVSGHLLIDLADRQELLQATSLRDQLEGISEILGAELEMLRLERKIEGDVKDRVSKGQKEYYLQEQMKAIRRELGEAAEDDDDTAGLRESIERAGMPKEAREKAIAELDRLTRMSPMSPEATVVRGYVETLASLPWKKRTRDRLDLEEAAELLDEDHYGLEKVKDRVLEYLAVVKLVQRPRGQILCLVGPPGVGKTSLGRSIARALKRKFVRMALGGVRDEAEIRGHRRTYIGSMPGRIIQGIRKAGTKNPVFLLDEIDKLSSDFRGDPSSALLEVLDPEQNRSFNDHYLDVDFDLSEVLFITTANVLPAIPPPLRDRMEILRLPGYLEPEKLGIAKKFLVPKQVREHGLEETEVAISDDALKMLIKRYTREAGVRSLEREIASLCRKVAREKLRKASRARAQAKRASKAKKKTTSAAKRRTRTAPHKVGVATIREWIGPPRYPERRLPAEDRVGVASGLAWTEYGGDILPVEVLVHPGSGKILLTGRLGEVMRESARAALSFARSRAGSLGLAPDFTERLDLHLHIPEGATPKDGPSAGICITTAVLSALTRIPVRRDVAMTGEITLHGEVLPIGGLNEKVVAAALAGYSQVLVPESNRSDWEEIAENARKGLEVTFVKHVDEVLRHALVDSPALDRLLAHDDDAGGIPGIAH